MESKPKSLIDLMCENEVKILQITKQLQKFEETHKGWKLLCQHSSQMGVDPTDVSTASELAMRLNILENDIANCINCLQVGISLEKARQKLYNIYETHSDLATAGPRNLMRQLDRAQEEMALKEAVTTATNRRQEQEAKLQNCMANSELTKTPGSSSTTAEKGDVNQPHQTRLQKNYSWLIDKVIAKSVAAQMFEQGAITWRELELIQTSAAPSQSAEQLIKILMEQPYEVFHCFKSALKRTKQDDIYFTLADIGIKITITQRYMLVGRRVIRKKNC